LLIKGDIFPSAEDTERIERENYFEKLLLNQPTGNYEMREVNGTLTRVPKDPLVPVPQVISDISADLLLGEFPAVILPDNRQEPFDDWAFYHQLGVKLLEGGTYVSALGTVFATTHKVDDEIEIDLIPSNKVVWEEYYNKLTNVKIILSVALHKNGNEAKYEIQEWYLNEQGNLVIEHYYAMIRLSDHQVQEVLPIDEPEMPGLDFIPIAKWINQGIMGKAYGRSDYSGKSQLFAEIDNRIDQNNNTIEENQDPWKAVPAGVLDENGNLNRSNFSAKMFEKTMGGQADNSVDIMAWDANMPAAFQQIDTMLDMTFFTSRLSNPITGRTKGGTSDSGRSLKWQSVSTIAMKQRKEKYAASFMRDFISHWSKIEGEEIDKKEIIIQWQDGLPIDETEKTEAIVQQVNAGLMSKETAIMHLQEINTEDAQAEIDKITADERTQAEIDSQSVAPIVV